MHKRVAKADWEVLRDSLGEMPEPVARPILVVVIGLPGTGKSYFSRRLAERFTLAIMETDALRRVLFPTPGYTAQESARLFNACHRLLSELLAQGIPVLLDATNLVEAHRERLYSIAERMNARLILVRVEAPVEVVQQRLEARAWQSEREGHSQADWSVYERMRSSAEPIARNHFAVDTSRDITPVIEKVVREIRRWLRT